MTTLVAAGFVAAVGIVAGSLWLLDQLDVIDRVRGVRALQQAIGVVVVVVALASPAAFSAGLLWYVEHKQDEMMGLIQPLLDGIASKTTVPDSPSTV